MSRRSLLSPAPPEVAIEIDSTHVVAARYGGASRMTSHALEPLPAGAVVPGLSAGNVLDAAAATGAVTRALARLGGRAWRVALVIPDTAAKVSLVRFETVPPNPADLAELVRWQVRKTAPFPIEQAVVSFTPGAKIAAGGQEYVVTVARADIVQQYEQVCERAGVHAGLVDIATCSIINGALSSPTPPAGDWLLVHATATYTTLAVIRDGELIFFRNRERDSEGTLADVVHQTAMYYEDRLKGAGFTRVLLAGTAVSGVDAVRRSLEQRIDVHIEAVAQPELAALAGILTRERKAA